MVVGQLLRIPTQVPLRKRPGKQPSVYFPVPSVLVKRLQLHGNRRQRAVTGRHTGDSSSLEAGEGAQEGVAAWPNKPPAQVKGAESL